MSQRVSEENTKRSREEETVIYRNSWVTEHENVEKMLDWVFHKRRHKNVCVENLFGKLIKIKVQVIKVKIK